MTNKEKQEWLEVKYPLTIISDRYDGTYSGASWLAFPLYCDEVPSAVYGYDEECAAFWANNLEPVGKGNSAQTALDNLIKQMHEFKSEESEDERIRKVIHKILLGMREEIFTAQDEVVTKDKALAYLERWKEQEHPDGCFTCDEYKKGYEAGRLNGLTAGYNKAMKEQKLAEWGEEDERMLSRCIKSVECSKQFADSETYKAAKDVEMNWLKFLPERFNLQPKQEWGEEDETRLTNILIMLKEYAIHHYSKDDVNKSIDWLENRLKSLRPLPQWKPSEEHFQALRRAIMKADKGSDAETWLIDLCEQLKKL